MPEAAAHHNHHDMNRAKWWTVSTLQDLYRNPVFQTGFSFACPNGLQLIMLRIVNVGWTMSTLRGLM